MSCRCDQMRQGCLVRRLMRSVLVVGLAVASGSFGVASASATQAPVRMLRIEEVRADLDSLQYLLDHAASYAAVNGYPYGRHLDSLRRLTTPMTVRDFGIALRDLIGRLQDAHSGVRLPDGLRFEGEDAGELPFPVTTLDGHVVAVSRDRAELLVPGYPRLAAINGVDIGRLLEVAGAEYRGHSPQRFLSRAARALGDLEPVLEQADALRGDTLYIRLNGDRGDTTIVTPWRSSQGNLPERGGFTADVMYGLLAYLRIPDMSDGEDPGEHFGLALVRAVMESPDFGATQGMIIDVRGNGGGARTILEYLLPFFMDGPLVYNAALAVGDTAGLGGRNLTTPDDPGLDDASRAAARAFVRRFRVPNGIDRSRFLETLYVAVAADRPTPYDYSDRPVAVLMDEWSFSATDIFLGAFGELPNVTLIGTASGGGSGRSESFELPQSRILVTLSTMASFQPSGGLYDGYGVQPDIVAEPTFEDRIGRTDSQLRAAVVHLVRTIRARPSPLRG